jgi:myo-inositol catabolism protein IolC
MSTDAIREALSATREAWQAADDELPRDDPERRAAAFLELENAILSLEEALRIAGYTPDD